MADAAESFHIAPLADREVRRRCALCSPLDEELSPAALAVRIVLTDTAQTLVRTGHWPGATLAD